MKIQLRAQSLVLLGLHREQGLSITVSCGGDPRQGIWLLWLPRAPQAHFTLPIRTAIRWSQFSLTVTAEQIMRKITCKHPHHDFCMILLQLCSPHLLLDYYGLNILRSLLSASSQDHKVNLTTNSDFHGRRGDYYTQNYDK